MPRVPIAVIQLPPRVPPADTGGECGINGPYLRQCFAGFPTPDYKSAIFVIEGVPDSASVEWTTTISPFDAVIVGSINARAILIRFAFFEASGTVTATVDGEPYSLAVNMAETPCDPA